MLRCCLQSKKGGTAVYVALCIERCRGRFCLLRIRLILAAAGSVGITGGKGENAVEKKGRHASCDSCGNYVYDEEYGYYVCEASLDEDEMAAFLGDRYFECPYYVTDDEYQIVRKQM